MIISKFICIILSMGMLFVGDFSLLNIPICLIFIPFSILTNIAFKNNGSKSLLKKCAIISFILLIFTTLSFYFNQLYLYDYYNEASFKISIFLISISPIIGWSFLNLDTNNYIKINPIKRTKNIATLLSSIIIFHLAGRNIAYRFNVGALFFILNTFELNPKDFFKKARINLQKIFNILAITTLSYFLITSVSKGMLFTFLLFSIIYILKKIVYPFLTRLRSLKLNIYYLFSGIFITLLTPYFLNFVFTVSPRLKGILSIFKDNSSLLSISVRQRFYSYLLNPIEIFTSINFFGTDNPPWSYYPHNAILDVLGNFGIIPFILLILIMIKIAFSYIFKSEAEHSLIITILFSVLIGSMVSGSAWDYYSLFAYTPFLLRELNLNKNVKLQKPKINE